MEKNRFNLFKQAIARYVLSLKPRKPSSIHDVTENRAVLFVVNVWLKISGNIYFIYKNLQVKIFVNAFNIQRKFKDVKILLEIYYHSRWMIIFLLLISILLILVSSVSPTSFSLSIKDINQILIVYSGGLIALLGIIFALYSVGFQMTTERFSSGVTDYLNREQVGKFLFKLMTFSSLFTLANLVVQSSYDQPMPYYFTTSSILVLTSLAAVLIFKDDYITKLKPRSVFERLYYESTELIRFVNLFDYPEVKSFQLYMGDNVQSFRIYLPVSTTYSLSVHMQKRLSELLEINKSLFEDLIQNKKHEDATFGISSNAYLLSEYISIKHFIDQKFGWWFPREDELVKSDSMGSMSIKLNYEAMGIGRLSQPVMQSDWVEDRILGFFMQIQKNTNFKENPIIGNSLINSYELMLAGRFSKTIKGYEKNVFGALENQYFELSEKIFNQFVDLGSRISGISDCTGNYINALVRIKTAMMDGFNVRVFPGRIRDWKPDIKKKLLMMIEGEQVAVSMKNIVLWKPPKYFYNSLVDVLEKLEVEEEVEGKVITDPRWISGELLEMFENKEDEIIQKRIDILIPSIIKLSTQTDDKTYKTYMGGVVLSIFNQLMSQERWEILGKAVEKYKKDLAKVFILIDKEGFIETELRNQIDHGAFLSLVKRDKSVFYFYLGLFNVAQSHLWSVVNTNDPKDVLKTLRRPLMLGGLSYLVSELDQDAYYVLSFTRLTEYFSNNQNIEDLYQELIDYRLGLDFFDVNMEEAQRYRSYFRQVINSISSLPKDYIGGGGPPFGISSRETVKHPSDFIRKMASFTFSDMRECHEGYVEWLKKRRNIHKLINMLNKIKNDK